jgi:hypothetical protein
LREPQVTTFPPEASRTRQTFDLFVKAKKPSPSPLIAVSVNMQVRATWTFFDGKSAICM